MMCGWFLSAGDAVQPAVKNVTHSVKVLKVSKMFPPTHPFAKESSSGGPDVYLVTLQVNSY